MQLNKISLYFRKFDWLIFITICLLIILGLVLLYSVALGSQSEQNILNLKKQIVFFIFGLLLIIGIALFFDYRSLLKYNTLLYVLSVILLASVLFFGRTIRGTTGWFDFGFFSFQPVEFIKIFLIIFLSKFFSDKARYIGQLKYVVLSSLGVILLTSLIVLQPDFGSALILFSLWFVLVLLTGLKKKYLFFIIIIFLISSLVLWFFIFQDYQKERIEVFLNPSLDPLGSGYNITQAIIAIGSGQVFGKGLAFGSQSQLKFLPESQTDFIFAVLAEELGLAGIVLLLMLFGFLFYRLLKITKTLRDNFAAYFVLSVCVLFFIQLIINIGGNLGLMPITGITLPFISYGGSSLISNMIMIGIVQSIVIRS
jgi:rod shape determining protein RodA